MLQLNALLLLLLSIALDGFAAPPQVPMNVPATTRVSFDKLLRSHETHEGRAVYSIP